MTETETTEYFDLTTPRKQAELLESSQNLAARAGGKANAGSSPRRQRAVNKENVGPPATPPESGKGCLTKAALKREQVVQQVAQAQADEKSRLFVFKAKADGAQADAPAGDPEIWSPAPDSRQAAEDSQKKMHLTLAHGPSLRTAARSTSREGRSCSTPSKTEPDFSLRSRGTSREYGSGSTPELSVRSMRSVRSMQSPAQRSRGTSRERVGSTPELSCGPSMRSVMSTTSAFSASLVGRYHCTRALTFPEGPNLATEARSRSHSVGARTASGTPERPVRSHSVHSARSASHTPRKLTVPHGPLLSTSLRARCRSHSVGNRTPSAHSACSVGSVRSRCPSVRSSCPLTFANGPVLATERRSRSRSCSVGAGTPAASSEYTPSQAERSVRSNSRPTVPRGPVLATSTRSRSRVCTPSEHSVRSCSAASFRSCCSARAPSVRSVSAGPRALTVPVGPLLETQLRSWARNHQACTPNAEVEQTHEAWSLPARTPASVEMSGSPPTVPAQADVKDPVIAPASEEAHGECMQDDAPSPLSLPDDSQSQDDGQPEEVVHAMSAAEEQASPEANCVGEQNSFEASAVEEQQSLGKTALASSSEEIAVAPAQSNLLEYLPETPQRGHLMRSPEADSVRRLAAACFDDMATPESRAASRKQEVLAKVAEDHANVRKKCFVFGKSGTTPMRTPARKKAEAQTGTEASAHEAGAQP